jgi:hypothetical protein
MFPEHALNLQSVTLSCPSYCQGLGLLGLASEIACIGHDRRDQTDDEADDTVLHNCVLVPFLSVFECIENLNSTKAIAEVL